MINTNVATKLGLAIVYEHGKTAEMIKNIIVCSRKRVMK